MTNTKSNTLGNGQWLLKGNSLWSNDGSVEFKMQDDGKIAVYWGGECRWQNTSEQRYDVKGLFMQEDGNLVLYTNDGTPIWSSDTARGDGSMGNNTTYMVVGNDGEFRLYNGTQIYNQSGGKK